jgi:hypothetical protein
MVGGSERLSYLILYGDGEEISLNATIVAVLADLNWKHEAALVLLSEVAEVVDVLLWIAAVLL